MFRLEEEREDVGVGIGEFEVMDFLEPSDVVRDGRAGGRVRPDIGAGITLTLTGMREKASTLERSRCKR